MSTSSTLPYITDHNSEVRKLGYKPPSSQKLMARQGKDSLQSLGIARIPQSQWKPVDFVANTPTSLINNQGQFGACVGASGCGGWQRQHFLRTGEVLALSWAYLYDQINGGSDNGANIIDSATTLEQMGVPLASAYSPKPIFKQNQPLPPGTAIYKESKLITLTDAIDCATALMMGLFPQVPIYVNSTFENFDSNGVAWNNRPPKGNASNHSIYLAGLKQINNQWFFIMVNSWGVSWGPFKNGTCLLPLGGIDNPSMQDDGYAHAIGDAA